MKCPMIQILGTGILHISTIRNSRYYRTVNSKVRSKNNRFVSFHYSIGTKKMSSSIFSVKTQCSYSRSKHFTDG